MRSRLMIKTVTFVLVACLVSKETVVAQTDIEIANSSGMKLVLIPKRTFPMGSPESEEVRSIR